MATTYKTPGVYVEEIPTLPASVAQVGTAIPAFIGYTEKAQNVEGTILTNIPTRITSALEFKTFFGGPPLQEGIVINVLDLVNSKGEKNRTIQALEPSAPSFFIMYYALEMFFMNGGGPCYIVSVGDFSESISSSKLRDGLDTLEKEDEPTLILFPDARGVGKKEIFYGLYVTALEQCNKLGDRFTIIDPFSTVTTAINDLRTGVSSDYLKYGATYYPFLKSSLNYNYLEKHIKVDNIVNTIDEEGNTTPTEEINHTLEEIKQLDDGLYNSILAAINKLTITLPPSSTMAGIYARVDNDRGVWKAPANVTLSGVIGPTIKITNEQQDELNIDPTGGKSINAIRAFSGKGILVWGARTMAGNDNEWRYISVRRFFNMVEESIQKSTAWVVFEPNDANTWLRVKGMIENYLNGLWRQGALVGAKPQQAYFVNVGLGTTMTPQDILEGRMNVEIGLATARPAEFIILKFSHKLQEV